MDSPDTATGKMTRTGLGPGDPDEKGTGRAKCCGIGRGRGRARQIKRWGLREGGARGGVAGCEAWKRARGRSWGQNCEKAGGGAAGWVWPSGEKELRKSCGGAGGGRGCGKAGGRGSAEGGGGGGGAGKLGRWSSGSRIWRRLVGKSWGRRSFGGEGGSRESRVEEKAGGRVSVGGPVENNWWG